MIKYKVVELGAKDVLSEDFDIGYQVEDTSSYHEPVGYFYDFISAELFAACLNAIDR